MLSADAPRQVRVAVWLLWASLAIVTAQELVSLFVDHFDEPFDRATMAALMAAGTGLGALFIYAASTRRRWARDVMLIIALVVLGFELYYLEDYAEEPWWSNALLVLTTAMDLSALCMLYLRESRQWYATPVGAR